MSTQPLPVHLLDGPAAGLQALGRFPLAHYLRPLHLNVLPLLLGQAVSMGRETAPRSAPLLGSGLSVPCRTRFWSAPERSKWMTRPVWGGSQTRVCDTGPQRLPLSLVKDGSQGYSAMYTSLERALPDTYGHVRTSRPRVSDLAGSYPETQRQQLLAANEHRS